MSAPEAVPAGDAQSLAAFRRLLESGSAEQGAADRPVLMTDHLVGPEAGRLLRRCAVPHEFDPALLAMLGDLDAAAAEERYAQFTELSIIQINENSLSVHERWRRPLWRWWLAPVQDDEFRALSQRLVEWFTAPANPTGEDPVARRRMFHLIGWRHDDGMQAFDRLFRAARHRRRFSECSLLLSLVHEYDLRLSAGELALLRYHEGKIAIDSREWEEALPLLRGVVADAAADSRLRFNAEVRVGHALRQLGQTDEATTALEGALRRASQDPQGAFSGWRAMYELGEIQRDQGLADDAVATLTAALEGARDDAEADADIAGILNSLGTAQLKLRNTDRAIECFDASLQRLRHDAEVIRTGTVLNNLGLARLEHLDYAAAEQAFSASLATKREAGDRLGQATTLLNMVRAQAAQMRNDEARRSAEQASALFRAVGDERGLMLALQAEARFDQRSGGVVAGPEGKGLPWWAWTLLVIGAVFLALVILISIVE